MEKIYVKDSFTGFLVVIDAKIGITIIENNNLQAGLNTWVLSLLIDAVSRYSDNESLYKALAFKLKFSEVDIFRGF